MARPHGQDGADLSEEEAQQRFLIRRRNIAWLLSCLLHLTLLIALALGLRVTPRGAAIEPDRSGTVVLARQVDDRREYYGGEDQSAAASQAAAEGQESPLPDAEPLALDASGVLAAADKPVGGGDVGDALPDAARLTAGEGPNRHLGGKAETSVFGLKGQGYKFLYVFDRSGSMEDFDGRPLAAAKAELIASLDDLDEVHQFQIIFYNQEPRVFNPTGGQPRMVYGNEQGKTLAKRFVGSIVASGGTDHMKALKMALRMHPDVIFFLTDANDPELTAEQLATIRRMNRGTTINAVEFGSGISRGGDNFLVRLARQNYGRHVYVDIAQLRRRQ